MTDKPNNTHKRGFASMSQEKKRAIAALGGKASGGNFKNDRERAREAGRRGGLNSWKHKNVHAEARRSA